MSCCSVYMFDLHAFFLVQNWIYQQSSKICFALIMNLLSKWTTTSWNMLMDNKFEEQILTGSATGNSCYHISTSHALNISCSFDPSVCLIESRCMVTSLTHLPLVPHICVSGSVQHWFRQRLVAYSAPSHYLNQCWIIVNWTLRNKVQWILIKIQSFVYMKMHP